MTEYVQNGDPIYEYLIALKSGVEVLGARFSPACERAFCVGHSEHADFRINGSSLHADAFAIERRANYLVLRPCYGSRHLRLNGRVVKGPTTITEYFRIDCETVAIIGRIYARVVNLCREPLPSEPFLVDPKELPIDCFPAANSSEIVASSGGVAIEDDSRVTVVVPTEPMHRFARGNERTTTHVRVVLPEGYLPTVIVPNKTVEIAVSTLPGCPTVGVAGCVPKGERSSTEKDQNRRAFTAPLHGPLGTVVVPCLAIEPEKPQETVVVPCLAIEPEKLNLERRIVSRRVKTSSKTENREDALCRNGRAPIQGSKTAEGNQRWQAPTTEYSAVELPTAQGLHVQEHTTTKCVKKPLALAEIGIWARRRPFLVFALALASGLVLATVAAFVLRAPKQFYEREKKVTTANTPDVALAQGVAPIVAPSAVLPNGDSFVDTPMQSSIAVSSGAGAINLETNITLQPVAINAIEHLVAGRHSEALRAYEKLLEQVPDSEVIRGTVRILTARLSKECDLVSSGKSQASFCPELLP